jgi:hypothetical protein
VCGAQGYVAGQGRGMGDLAKETGELTKFASAEARAAARAEAAKDAEADRAAAEGLEAGEDPTAAAAKEGHAEEVKVAEGLGEAKRLKTSTFE